MGTENYRETQRSRSSSSGKISTSTSFHVKERPLIPAWKVRLMGQGWAIVLNAGYRDKNGATEYIPYKCKIKVFDEYKQLTQWSASQWSHTRQVFRRRSPQQSVDPEYLSAGVKLALEFLCLPTTAEVNQQIADQALSGF